MSATFYIVKAETIKTLWERARGVYDVVAKTRDVNGNLNYGRPRTWEEVIFTEEQPRLSAKEYIFPQTETLTTYRRAEDGYEVNRPEPPSRPLLIFGLNTCDAAAFDIIDRVFTWDYRDDPYWARREMTTLFALACTELHRDCFCDRLDYGEDGIDVVAYPMADGYLLKVQTAKGEDFVGAFADLLSKAPDDAGEALQRHLADSPLAKKGPLLNEARPTLAGAFNHPDWENLVSTCIGCGICTYLCPTCHCFDIQDEGGTLEGRRIRTWDHCTGRMFTLMAAHQPRDRQYKRYRQRLLHKFWYYPERFGPPLCTGCGRCTTYCPVKINIKELVEYFSGMKEEPPGGKRR